ncbi:AI-2E family transporter [Croceibacterium aestuarii]|uniref:AI-2E family transporter n=1 Tax=Croceibacterium aestuarii TaxID=3064139 RepID=UPI00272E4C1D|nr:AI-2E family transporter [Croceibacterium sp. D39]
MSDDSARPPAKPLEGEAPVGSSPTHISNPKLRYEAERAFVWSVVVGFVVLAVYLAQSLLVIVGALVFATLLDGGTRLLGRWLPLPRLVRLLIVMLCAIAFMVWLMWSAGSQISQQAAEFPALVVTQIERFIAFLTDKGFSVGQDEIQRVVGSVFSGVGTVTRAIGGLFGAVTTMVLIVIIGLYLAIDPRPYERGIAWMLPEDSREPLAETFDAVAFTLRRLLAGRLAGMVFEGLLTFALLKLLGVPMAALLGIITGLLAFIPNIGAIVSGVLMTLVGFSVSTEIGLWTIGVYFLVQNFDGYIVVPMIAKKTVDLAPALVLMAQLIFGVLFGILGLALADPMLVMIKVALERRAERLDRRDRSRRESVKAASA